MSPETRLLDYIDRMAPPVTTEEAIARRQSPNRSWAKTQAPGPGRGLAWAAAAFLVVTLAVGGVYIALSGDDGDVVNRTTVPTPTTVLTTLPPSTAAPNPTLLQQVGDTPIGRLDPGAYFIDANTEPPATEGATFVIEGTGWSGGEEGVGIQDPRGSDHGWTVSLWVYQILDEELYAPSCDVPVHMPIGTTAADLADSFAASGFTVREAPMPVSAFGSDGYHVVVEVPGGCDGTGAKRNIFLLPGLVMEVWVFDVRGHVILVEANWDAESSEEDLVELRAVIDTLMLTP